jgi:hypothetical protein
MANHFCRHVVVPVIRSVAKRLPRVDITNTWKGVDRRDGIEELKAIWSSLSAGTEPMGFGWRVA